MNVLISLHRGYGIGDACQVSVIFQHLRKHRPNWQISYQAEEGKHQVGRQLVEHHFAYGTPYPVNHYDEEHLICLYDKWLNFQDTPNTHVVACLKGEFGIEWDRECSSYKVSVREEVIDRIRQSSTIYLNGGNRRVRTTCVAIHYQGNSASEYKNLTHLQADEIRRIVFSVGKVPLLLDYQNPSPIVGPRMGNPDWGRDIEYQCAVISQCCAFIGIDSGPAKCASATDTSSLVIWTGHHPVRFHDLAPNTTHLVPFNFHSLPPVNNDPGVVRFFETNYSFRRYCDDVDMMEKVKQWLREVLR